MSEESETPRSQCGVKFDGMSARVPLTFERMREVGLRRTCRWHPGGITDWSLADWMTGFLGEVGEACEVVNDALSARRPRDRKDMSLSEISVALGARIGGVADSIKKLNRVRDSIVGNRDVSPAALRKRVRANALDAIEVLQEIADRLADPDRPLAELVEAKQPALELTEEERRAFGEEMADSLLMLDLAAAAGGIELEPEAVSKFNTVSIRCNFPERL